MIVIESLFIFIICFFAFELLGYKYEMKHVEHKHRPEPHRKYKKKPPPRGVPNVNQKKGYNKNNRYVTFHVNPKNTETSSGKAKKDL